jgi:hypothetical protein
MVSHPEHGGSMFLRNVPTNLSHYAVSNSRRLQYNVYTGCPGRNVPDFGGGVFLTVKYTDITQNTYVQS